MLALISQESETSQLYHSIFERHSNLVFDHQTFGGSRTHIQALKHVETLAVAIESSFREFIHSRKVSLVFLTFGRVASKAISEVLVKITCY